MLNLGHDAGIANAVDSVREQLALGRSVVVRGATGAGRGLVCERLAQLGHLVVEPPSLDDADAPLHALLQVAAALGPELLELAQRDELGLGERALRLARALAQTGRPLIFRQPASWRARKEHELGEDARLRSRRANEVMSGLLSAQHVLIPATREEPLGERVEVSLARMPLPLDDIDATHFGNFAQQAEDVKRWCGARQAEPTPLQFRVTVALHALGGAEPELVDYLADRGPGLQILESRLARALHGSKFWRRAALRAAMCRRPLPADVFLAIAGVTQSNEAPLLTECLGYPTAQGIVMHERVREIVLDVTRDRDAELEAHQRLADQHAKLDGQRSPTESPSVIDWLETTHHLAHAGPAAAERWSNRSLRCRELFWDRARALSLQGHYVAAADVYARCLEVCGPNDDYAQHYRAFNLDRAGERPDEVRKGFEAAVGIRRDNAWWNARLVTHLIGRGQFVAARRAYGEALRNVDEDGERTRESAWLALNFHRWIVEAWLDAGEVELAREVFDAVHPATIAREDGLRALEATLLDAEEAQALGESVYPASTPLDKRWLARRVVPDVCASGAERIAWYPGRVVDRTAEGVLLVFAIPDPRRDARRARSRELSADEWQRAAGRPIGEAHGFIEIGSYADGSLVIEPIDEPAPERRRDPLDELRYLQRWRAATW